MKRLYALTPEARTLVDKARAWGPSTQAEQRMQHRLESTLSSPSPYAAPPTRLPLAALEQEPSFSQRSLARRLAKPRFLPWGAFAAALASIGFLVGRGSREVKLDPSVPQAPTVEATPSPVRLYDLRLDVRLPSLTASPQAERPRAKRARASRRQRILAAGPPPSLAEELSWLSHAESLLRQEKPANALQWLRAHRFVSRTHEALALTAIAQCQAQHVGHGRRSMHRVLRQWPDSVFSARMRAACK